MKKIHLILLTTNILFITSQGFSQTNRLQLSKTQLNFQPLFDGQTDSLNLTVSNNWMDSLYLRLRIPFQEYGTNPFYLRDSVLILGPNQSQQIRVYAAITHNVVNKAALILQGSTIRNATHFPFLNPVGRSIPLTCQGKFRKSYYNTTQNLSEEALKQALKTKLGQNYNSLGYNEARDNMYGTLDNFNDTVTCIYTNRKAKFNTRAGATANNFNCEHTFPQGFFNSDEPMRSDIHHLYSTDENANNSRGNLPFGIAVPPLIQTAINFPSKNGGGKYEPQDSHKGRCARSMMYFVLRYQDYTNFYTPQDSILRSWHRQVPVTALDTVRNNGIFQLQNNRNPFVDYPQFENRISNLTGLSVSDSIPRLNVSNDLIYVVNSLSATLDSFYSFSIWNSGNKPLIINRLKPQNVLGNNMVTLVNPMDTVFSVPRNSSKTIWIKLNNFGYDTLRIQSNAPQQALVKIPVESIWTSIEKTKTAHPRIKVFPNPTSKTLNFSGLSPEFGFEFELRDVLGKSIFQQILLQGDKPQVELPETPSGFYQVVVSQNGFSYSEKLLINR